MKIGFVLLTVSLAANIGVAAWWLSRRPVVRPTASQITSAATPGATKRTAPSPAPDLKTILETGDAKALAAAGCSPDLVRTLLLGRAFDRFQSRIRASRAPFTNQPFWRNVKNRPDDELGAAMREFDQSLRDTLGIDIQSIVDDSPAYGFLSPEKRMRVLQIQHDYEEMEQKLRAECQGVLLASDKQKLKYLEAERERDLAAALSPEEAAAQERWQTAAANTVRSIYGEAIENEEQYRAIYALQEAFDQRWRTPAPDKTREAWNVEAREAARQLDAEVRRIVGAEAWDRAAVASDADVRNARLVAQRVGAPDIGDSVVAMRASYAAQSLQIQGDETLTPAQRKADLTALGTRAVNDLNGLLGNEGGAALAQTMQWVQFLRRGSAFSTDPTPAQVPHPVGPVVRSFEVPGPRPAAARAKKPGP